MMKFGNFDSSKLEAFIQRIERLEEEKKNISEDVREVYSEAKAMGYDVKIMRQIVKLRKMDEADRQEMEYLLDTYKRALNLVSDNIDSSEPENFEP